LVYGLLYDGYFAFQIIDAVLEFELSFAINGFHRFIGPVQIDVRQQFLFFGKLLF
jgi:hypothetical protein